MIFPDLRVIFILRDPREMMASLKFITQKVGGDGQPGQYHPVVYSLYWRDAAETIARYAVEEPGLVCRVKFEDLISKPNAEAARLADFLGSRVEGDVMRTDANTSFSSAARKSITPTEMWICEKIAGDAMRERAYPLSGERPRFRDVGDLVRVSLRFTQYQIGRIIRDTARRESIKAFVRRRFGKRTSS